MAAAGERCVFLSPTSRLYPVSGGQPIVKTSAAELCHGAGSGDASQVDDTRTAYLAAVGAAILSKWTDTNTNIDGCTVVLEQEIGGGVMQAKVMGCSIDPSARYAIEGRTIVEAVTAGQADKAVQYLQTLSSGVNGG